MHSLAATSVHNTVAATIISVDANDGHYVAGGIDDFLESTCQHEIKKYVHKALNQHNASVHLDFGKCEEGQNFKQMYRTLAPCEAVVLKCHVLKTLDLSYYFLM